MAFSVPHLIMQQSHLIMQQSRSKSLVLINILCDDSIGSTSHDVVYSCKIKNEGKEKNKKNRSTNETTRLDRTLTSINDKGSTSKL